MKESKVTGKEIYNVIRNLEFELEELTQACDQISDDMGTETTAYRLLHDAYNEKNKELNRFLNAEYKPHVVDIVSFGMGLDVFE